MDVSKFLSPDQLQQFSLAARLANGEIPEKVSFAELALMTHPEDIDARKLFLQTLYAASRKSLDDPDRLQVGITTRIKDTTASAWASALTVKVQPSTSETDEPKPLPFEPGLSANYPRKTPESEPLPDWLCLAPSLSVTRTEYRRWCGQQGKTLPSWWFTPEERGESGASAEEERTKVKVRKFDRRERVSLQQIIAVLEDIARAEPEPGLVETREALHSRIRDLIHQIGWQDMPPKTVAGDIQRRADTANLPIGNDIDSIAKKILEALSN